MLEEWDRRFRTLFNQTPPLDFNWHSKEQNKSLSHVDTGHPTATVVATVLKSRKNNQAPGNDDLQTELFKFAGDQLVVALGKLLEGVWHEKRIPEKCKTATIVPFFKIVHVTECENCRGMSLLPMSLKIRGHILLQRIADAYDKVARENGLWSQV